MKPTPPALDATTEQMRALVAAVARGSFSGAARSLRKTQSAVSQNIASLEAALGVALFDRSAYRPRLTPAGELVHEAALRIVAEIEELAGVAHALAAGDEAQLSLAVDEFFPMPVVVRALAELRTRFPRTRLVVRTGALGRVAELVLSGEAALGISGPLEKEPASLVRQPLRTVGLVPVVAPTHPLAAEPAPIPLRTLRAHVQVVLTDPSPYTEGARRGIVSTDVCMAGSLATKRAFLLGGLGWGTLPRHLVDDDLRARTLVRIQPHGWSRGDYPVRLDAAWLRPAPPGRAGRWLLERLAV